MPRVVGGLRGRVTRLAVGEADVIEPGSIPNGGGVTA